ncbi:hypothetical protein PABG_04942 [Paracoccidioides brasiliensis Pb03]|nr:hypothetical protein PABG_04942 [Paracoccidioides brasiliensis Pb03]
MSRKLKVLVAQVGSIRIDSDRKETKTALTTFFPRHILTKMSKGFFDAAQSLGRDVCIGYADLTGESYNILEPWYGPSQARDICRAPYLTDPSYNLVPGAHWKDEATSADTGGKSDTIVSMMICNDRCWPESRRAYGLQGVELVLCGYNTPDFGPDLYGEPNTDPQTAKKEA